jgi:hypothetical protein
LISVTVPGVGAGLGLANRPELESAHGGEAADREAGAAQEGAAVHGLGREAGGEALQLGAAGFAGSALGEHGLCLTS